MDLPTSSDLEAVSGNVVYFSFSEGCVFSVYTAIQCWSQANPEWKYFETKLSNRKYELDAGIV